MSVEQAGTPTPEAAPVADMATVLHALADPVRLEIVCQLDRSELPCGALDVPVGKSTCSHHLKTLSAAGVVAERGEGTRKFMSLRRADLERAYPGLLTTVLAGKRNQPAA